MANTSIITVFLPSSIETYMAAINLDVVLASEDPDNISHLK